MPMTIVKLHLYDLSNGMARAMSRAIIGKQLDGIWHSGIAVFDVEYFFGGGICAAPAGRAIPGLAFEEIILGRTSKTQIELEIFLQSISSRFTQATYSLLRHNCNNFANEVAQYLLSGVGIPDHIIRLPQEFLSSPMGLTMAPMIESMERNMREAMVGGGQGLNPFGHIPRTPIFPAASTPVPSLAKSVAFDARLLKTALDGIPLSVMSEQIKEQILTSDSSVFPHLVEIMTSKFQPKKSAILLSFGTIIRSFICDPTFREALQGSTIVRDILTAGLGDTNPHVSAIAMGIACNLTSTELFDQPLVEEIVVPSLQQAVLSPSKLSLMTLANVFRFHAVDRDSYSLLEAVATECLVADHLNAEATELLMEAVEIAAGRMLAADRKSMATVDPSNLISVAERLEAQFSKHSLQSTIRLHLE